MEHENDITGYLASLDIKNRGDLKVANFELRSGGSYIKATEKWEPNYFPMEAWLDDHIKKLENAKLGDLLTIKYRAVPRKLDLGDFKKKVIVWKTIKIKNWSEIGGKKDVADSVQIAFNEEIFKG
ncbi:MULTISPECIES: hypothetical protein [Bacillota]|uniref:hypothetical protein n=1 Tax=Bacillota TaxID=1239 RepID=UPI0039F14D7E